MTAAAQPAPAPIREPRVAMVGDGFARARWVTLAFDVPCADGTVDDVTVVVSPAHAAALRDQLDRLDLPRASR